MTSIAYRLCVLAMVVVTISGVRSFTSGLAARVDDYGQTHAAELGCITDSECELGPLRGYNQYGIRDSGPSQEYDYSTIPDPQ